MHVHGSALQHLDGGGGVGNHVGGGTVSHPHPGLATLQHGKLLGLSRGGVGQYEVMRNAVLIEKLKAAFLCENDPTFDLIHT
jgi:hypothetical protein